MTARKSGVLVVSADEQWQKSCESICRANGYDVLCVSDALQALALLRRRVFSVIIADDSSPESMAPLEFALNVRDLVTNEPHILLGGRNLDAHRHVWRRFDVAFAGPKNQLLSAIAGIVSTERLLKAPALKNTFMLVGNEVS